MDEKTVTMMEGVAREWRVRVMDSAGNVLDPAGFSFYGGAADGMQVPRRMQVRVEGDVAVLVLPGLWMSGRCWRYQVLCQDVLTGVEWVLCQGDVVLERRVACNGPALHEDAVLVDAVLDSELEQVEVFLGDSTAASAEAARRAEASREAAEAEAARAGDAAAKAEDLKRVALDAAAGAALSAEGAEESKRGAEAAAADADADARVAEGKAAEAEASREAAEAAQREAGARAAEADASAKVAADAASDALDARDVVLREKAGFEVTAAEFTAAVPAAEQVSKDLYDTHFRQWLLERFGADRYEYFRDNEQNRIIIQTDRYNDAELDSLQKLIGNAVPHGVDVQHANYLPMQRIMKKLPPLLDSALGGEGRHNLSYDESAAAVAVEIAYPNIDDESTAAVNEILAYELPPEVSSTCGYGVTQYVVDYLLYEFAWDKRLTNIFPKANYSEGFALPADMPEPEILKSKTKPGAVFAGSTLKAIPDSWTMEGATDLYETFQAMPYLETLPAGMTFEKVKNAAYAFTRNGKFVPPETLKLTAMENATGAFFEIGAERMPESITFENVTQAENMCWSLKTYLRDISTQANFGKLINGRAAFNKGRFTKDSALRVLNTIPEWTDGKAHLLMIGIHIDHQNDEEVLAAISNAEAKGWTLTVQWNGTPTSSASVTYGLRKPPIYARVSELENGEHYIDWGHYVTDSSGYEEFRSVEAAAEYFGIQLDNN